MPRLARVTIPGIPHHVTQRGNRRQPVFFSDEDRQTYLRILLTQSRRYGVRFWAYCLMDNHVHFIAVPERTESLARTFGEAHRRYTSMVNAREGWTGYLWQGRFASFPLNESHLSAAIRYVERNPVEVGLVARAEDYPWSSARAHVHKLDDPLLTGHFLLHQIRNWAEFLRVTDAGIGRTIELHSSSGRPLGDLDFLERLERMTGRPLQRHKPGRNRKHV